MNSLFNIYVYLLEDGKRLLCAKDADARLDVDSRTDAILDAGLYQEIVANNPIVCLEEIEFDVRAWQVDAFVHLQMHKHGIELVRGGRYRNIVLSTSEKEEISNAIKFFAYDLLEQEARKTKLQEFMQEPLDVNTANQNIHTYLKAEDIRKRFEINRGIIEELDWLQQIIKIPEPHFVSRISKRYYKLMGDLGNVYEHFLKEIDSASQLVKTIVNPDLPICEVYFQRPSTFFDKRVILEEREDGKYDLDSDAVLPFVIKVFELAIYTLINREDEAIFERDLIDLQENKDKLFIKEHVLRQTC
jgi:hypothetical protein